MIQLLVHTLRRYPRAFIWVATLIGVCAVHLVFAAVILDGRATAWRFSEQSVRNAALLTEQDLARTIASFDLSLQAVRDGVADPDVMALAPALRHQVLFDRAATAEGLGTILVVDKNGQSILGSAERAIPPMDFSHRDFFEVHRNSPVDVGLYVSRPFRSRFGGGEWRIGLSRRIARSDGSFLGVVVGGLRLSSIAALFDRIDLGSDAAISLLRDDGTFVVGSHGLSEAIDSDQSASELLHKMLQGDAGLFVSDASADRIERLYASRRLANLPLRLAIGRAVAPIEEAWWRKALILMTILAIMSMAVGGLVKMLDKELLRRIQAERRSASLARTDGLTTLANRRLFDEALQREWGVALGAGTPLSLMICDIDWFKAFNDRYGHQAGDRALVAVAGVIAQSLRRSSDLAARYGGDEFVVLLPKVELSEVEALAKSIGLGVHGLAIPHEGSMFRSVTISCGVACLVPEQGLNPSMLLEAADQALYRAKQAGRHNIVRHEGLSPAAKAAA